MDMEQVIASARERGVKLSVMIVADPPLVDEEKEVLKANRDAAVALITGMVSAEQLEAARSESYALGIQHATEELATRAPIAAPLAPTHVTTVDEAMTAFSKWMGLHGEYWQWEIECLDALRATLVDGDVVHGLFAYSCIVEHADGRREEFQRRPSRKK